MTIHSPTERLDAPQPPQVPPRELHHRPAWTPGRVIALVVSLLALLGGIGFIAAGAAVLKLDRDHRIGDYLTSDEIYLGASGYAVTANELDLDDLPSDVSLGRARLRVTGEDPGAEVFVGLAEEDDAAAYLAGVEHSTLTELSDPATEYTEHKGGAPSGGPLSVDIWVEQASGTGTQTIDWPLEEGRWAVVVMNADGSAGIDVDADVGVTAPWVRALAIGLLVAGGLAVLAGGAVAGAIGRRVNRYLSLRRSAR